MFIYYPSNPVQSLHSSLSQDLSQVKPPLSLLYPVFYQHITQHRIVSVACFSLLSWPDQHYPHWRHPIPWPLDPSHRGHITVTVFKNLQPLVTKNLFKLDNFHCPIFQKISNCVLNSSTTSFLVPFVMLIKITITFYKFIRKKSNCHNTVENRPNELYFCLYG